jgi:hypothetical protein
MLTGDGMALHSLVSLGVLLAFTVAFAAEPPDRPRRPPASHGDSDLDDEEYEGSVEPNPEGETPSAPDTLTPHAPNIPGPAEPAGPDAPASI